MVSCMCVGIYAQNLTDEIAPSHDLIALSCIDGNLAQFGEFFAVDELLDTFIPQELVIDIAKLAIGMRAGMNVV